QLFDLGEAIEQERPPHLSEEARAANDQEALAVVSLTQTQRNIWRRRCAAGRRRRGMTHDRLLGSTTLPTAVGKLCRQSTLCVPGQPFRARYSASSKLGAVSKPKRSGMYSLSAPTTITRP